MNRFLGRHSLMAGLRIPFQFLGRHSLMAGLRIPIQFLEKKAKAPVFEEFSPVFFYLPIQYTNYKKCRYYTSNP